MQIYVSHSRNFDFQNELYKPLKESSLNTEHHLIFPHEDSDQPFDSKTLLQEKKCHLVLAEVSFPATGQGIELGWADAYGVPILCIHKKGVKISGSLKVVTKDFLEYASPEDLVSKLQKKFQDYGK